MEEGSDCNGRPSQQEKKDDGCDCPTSKNWGIMHLTQQGGRPNPKVWGNGHPVAGLLGEKELVPKKGFGPPSFGNSFSLNQIAALIEYNRLADFATNPICSTWSSDSMKFCPIRGESTQSSQLGGRNKHGFLC
jgi:hypothetical protein